MNSAKSFFHNRLSHWFENAALKRLFKNAGILLKGNTISSLLALGSFALTTRAIGPEKFGILITIQDPPSLLKYFAFSNLISSIRLSTGELDIITIGGVIGVAGAGMFRIAKLFSSILIKIFDPLYDTIYPELSKLCAARKIKEFFTLSIRTGITTGGSTYLIVLGFILFGGHILHSTVGSQYLPIYSTMIIYMVAVVIAIITIRLTPAALALGKYSIHSLQISAIPEQRLILCAE